MTTIDTLTSASARSHTLRHRPSRVGAFAGAVFRGIEWIDGRFARRRSRLALLSLNDAELKDIGISRADAHGEARRPFWD
jgi:uncharacterized protein YjiS (DUF1127 family)